MFVINKDLWLFAYGSLLWRPGVDFDESYTGRVDGWSRRFWQGSPDHRGTPEKPGRVVTLVSEPGRQVTGRVYKLSAHDLGQTLRYLDHRESGGYSRCWVTVSRLDITPVRALTYVALPGNPHYLGPASAPEIETHIKVSSGPSGANIDYYLELMSALGRLNVAEDELEDLSF